MFPCKFRNYCFCLPEKSEEVKKTATPAVTTLTTSTSVTVTTSLTTVTSTVPSTTSTASVLSVLEKLPKSPVQETQGKQNIFQMFVGQYLIKQIFIPNFAGPNYITPKIVIKICCYRTSEPCFCFCCFCWGSLFGKLGNMYRLLIFNEKYNVSHVIRIFFSVD